MVLSNRYTELISAVFFLLAIGLTSSLCDSVSPIALRVVGRPGKSMVIPLSTSSIGLQFNLSYIFTKLVPTRPIDACSRILNVNEVQNGIAFVIRGGCSFVTKASFAQVAGSVAFISYDYINNTAMSINMVPDETSKQVGIPCAFMQGSYAQNLLEIMESENRTFLDVDFPVDINGLLLFPEQYSPLRLV